jgi:glutamyl/glutaminyl-tRNA synthetase
MDWTQAFTIIASLGTFTFWLFTKIDNDVRAQGQRIDQLYQMFVDLIKEGRK